MKALVALCSAAALSIGLGGTASAGPIECSECAATYKLMVNGEDVARGSLTFDEKGNINLSEPVGASTEDFSISLDSLSGNVDPFLLFSLSGTNNSNASLTYSAAFSLPISLGGQIKADASVSYSLTDGAGDGATLFPTSGVGKVVDSQDIRIAPFLSTDKGVDVGDACTVGPPAGAYTCGPYNATNVFGSAGGPTYDLMSVIVSFGLTPHDAAGVSGRVSQTPVPEPGTALLLASGLAGILASRRRD